MISCPEEFLSCSSCFICSHLQRAEKLIISSRSSDEGEDHKSDKRRWHPLSLTPSAILIQEECVALRYQIYFPAAQLSRRKTRDIAPQSKVTEWLYTFCVSADLKLFPASLGSTKTQLNLLLLSVVADGKMSRSRVKGHLANKFSERRSLNFIRAVVAGMLRHIV